MFKGYKISLNRVHDTVTIKEGGDSLTLYVDADPMRMVAGISQAQRIMQALNEESTEDQQRDAALYFAGVIFGKEQAEQLFSFYHKDSGCLFNVCGKYFSARLSKMIAKAQKKQ